MKVCPLLFCGLLFFYYLCMFIKNLLVMKKLILLLSFVSFLFSSLYAVKAYPGLIEITQPNGVVLNVYLYGDENFSYMTTEDGYLVKYNDLGFIEYAQIGTNGAIESVGVFAHNVVNRTQLELDYLRKTPKVEFIREKLERIGNAISCEKESIQRANAARSSEGFPLKGSPKSLVILVNFENLKFKSPAANADFTRMLNQYNYAENSATGSARDYFRTASNGVFEPNFVVVGPYDLPHATTYYGKDENGRIDVKAGNLIVDACTAADADVDFTEYDTNADGYIDNVFVYYAGYNQAEGGGVNTIWPHRSVILTDVYYDGVRIYDYACTSEFRSNKGAVMCGIGTFCHEFGHVLSLPDLYATNDASHATMGSWDIMDKGSYNNNGRTPPTYSAYERFYLGWLTPTQLTVGAYNLEPIAKSNKAYLIAANEHNLDGKNPDSNEFFLLENRHKDYENDGVPANGMLVTHITYSRSKWNNNIVNNDPDDMGVEVVCAFGTTSTPHQNVFPGSAEKTSISFTIADALIDTITSIVSEDNIISFVYGSPDFVPSVKTVGELEDFSVEFGQAAIQTLELNGEGILDGDISIDLSIADNYAIRLVGDSDTNFVKSIKVTPDEEGNFNAKIDIKFEPKVYSILSFLSDNIVVSSKYSELNIAVRGKAKKPVLVVPPVAYEAENVTPYTFTAVWDTVFDATEYLLSVYNLAGNDTLFVLQNHVLKADKSDKMKFDVVNLLGGTDYKYRVKASDKDPYGSYENITDYSNEISVTTLPGYGVESRKLDVLKNGDKYMIYLPVVDENHSIFVYSLEGHLITPVPVLYNIVELPVLASNRVYILKYASNDGLKRKSKVIKLYYE